jgi:hypothetical protein
MNSTRRKPAVAGMLTPLRNCLGAFFVVRTIIYISTAVLAILIAQHLKTGGMGGSTNWVIVSYGSTVACVVCFIAALAVCLGLLRRGGRLSGLPWLGPAICGGSLMWQVLLMAMPGRYLRDYYASGWFLAAGVTGLCMDILAVPVSIVTSPAGEEEIERNIEMS